MLLCPSLVGIAQSMLELWSIEMLTEICLDFFKEKEITLVLRAVLNIAAEYEIVEILWTRRDMLRKRVYLIMCSCRLGCSKVPPWQFVWQSEHFGNLTFDLSFGSKVKWMCNVFLLNLSVQVK